MSKIKDYIAETYDAGDGVADMDALQEAQEKWELEKLEKKYKEE